MGEPLTILGGIAASSQIAGQLISLSVKIYELYQEIQDAPPLIRKQLKHVEQLSGIARLILENRGLQTDSVASVLGTCLCEVHELRRLLQSCKAPDKSRSAVKFQKTLIAVMNGKKVRDLFERLDREKASLLLCVQEADSYVLL